MAIWLGGHLLVNTLEDWVPDTTLVAGVVDGSLVTKPAFDPLQK